MAPNDVLPVDLQQRAKAVHDAAIVIDTHCDTLGRVIEGRRRLGDRSTDGQFDLPRAIDGGLTAEVMATFVSEARHGDGIRQSIDFIDVLYQELEDFPDLAMLATSGDDIRTAKASGCAALLLGMEGAEGLGGSLRALRTFYRLGLRVLGITWNRRNEAAEGIGDMRSGGGLSRFGVDLVKTCNDLGILLDLSHLSPAGVDDVLSLTGRPVVATHANAAAVHLHPRNLDDRRLEAIAATGGVIGVVPVPPFLGPFDVVAPLESYFEHLDHIISVVGDEHVGLGLDFDGVGVMRTQGIETVADLRDLTSAMVARGSGDERIRNILGGNFLRVFDEVLGHGS